MSRQHTRRERLAAWLLSHDHEVHATDGAGSRVRARLIGELEGVARTSVINFVSDSVAYVGGIKGNVQTFDYSPALANTGADPSVVGALAALGAGLLATGALAVIMVRRRRGAQ